ncbi:MAG: SPOR domain-containing protein [Terriglobia bacterium]
MRTGQQGRGLSVRQLTFIFFGAVGVCALFFALGFLLGVNRRSEALIPAVEQVPLPGAIPPTVDSSLQNAGAGSLTSNARQATVIEQNLKETSESRESSQPSPGLAQGSASATNTGNGKPAARTTPVTAATTRTTRLVERSESSERIKPIKHVERGVMVQVAALRTGRDAQSLLHTLKSHGYAAVMLTPAEAHDSLYRVQVGPFATRAEAVRTLHRLSSQGFRPFIRQ